MGLRVRSPPKPAGTALTTTLRCLTSRLSDRCSLIPPTYPALAVTMKEQRERACLFGLDLLHGVILGRSFFSSSSLFSRGGVRDRGCANTLSYSITPFIYYSHHLSLIIRLLSLVRRCPTDKQRQPSYLPARHDTTSAGGWGFGSSYIPPAGYHNHSRRRRSQLLASGLTFTKTYLLYGARR